MKPEKQKKKSKKQVKKQTQKSKKFEKPKKKEKNNFNNTEYWRKRKQIRWLIWTGIIMLIGLFFLKIIPMELFGEDILFDASAHITLTVFVLYLVWFYVDQNKSWRNSYLVFSLVVLTLVALQRIVVEKHDGTGLLLGFILSVIAILVPRWNKLKNKFDF